MIHKTLAALLIGGSLMLGPSTADAQCGRVREIPHAGLPDIAMTSADGYGLLIYYNPYVVQQVGPLISAFFKAHEYGHVCLGHVQQQLFNANPFNRQWMSLQHEFQADCYAARQLRNSNPAAVRAAIAWFRGQGPIQMVPTHPPGTARAQNIAACANDR